jgi:hypothetical protein
MKPTFDVHFSNEHPKHPGLWLTRRENFISVLDVQQSDIERDQRDTSWLTGEWGAEIKLTDRDTVGFQRKRVQDYLDARLLHSTEKRKELQASLKLLTAAQDRTEAGTALSIIHAKIECFQSLRLDLLGESLVLPEDDNDELEDDVPKAAD